jgi:hypothetical protein
LSNFLSHWSTNSSIRAQHCSSISSSVGGCPSHLSSVDQCHAVRLVTGTQAASAKDAARQLSEVKGRNIHPRTVRQTLQQAGLKAVKTKKKPLLKPHHRRGRLHFCQKYQHWTVRDWMRVIFSNEAKVNRLGSDERAWAGKTRAGASR